MIIDRGALLQIFKYAVYALLTLNVYWFFADEQLAAQLQYPLGVKAGDLIEAYAAAIDTAAWVVLLLMFELETFVLEEHHFTKKVTWALHGVRVFCYSFIVYAFYGYMAIAFQQFGELPAVVDVPGLRDIQYLAWVNVINAGVWLLIVLILEIDVRLQERDQLNGLALTLSTWFKFGLYAILLLAAIYWAVKGDFVDFWDAFLWLVAFFFIEMNVTEWRRESLAEQGDRPQAQ